MLITIGLVLSVSLIAAVIAVLLTSAYYSRFQFDTINEICGVMLRQEPKSEELISVVLKECIKGTGTVRKNTKAAFKADPFRGRVAFVVSI